MAEQLVEAMTDEFDPAKYKDEYREALLPVIQAKVEGVEVAEPEPVAESANLVDLMKLLEASVKAATDERARTARPRSSRREGGARPVAADETRGAGPSRGRHDGASA